MKSPTKRNPAHTSPRSHHKRPPTKSGAALTRPGLTLRIGTYAATITPLSAKEYAEITQGSFRMVKYEPSRCYGWWYYADGATEPYEFRLNPFRHMPLYGVCQAAYLQSWGLAEMKPPAV